MVGVPPAVVGVPPTTSSVSLEAGVRCARSTSAFREHPFRLLDRDFLYRQRPVERVLIGRETVAIDIDEDRIVIGKRCDLRLTAGAVANAQVALFPGRH